MPLLCLRQFCYWSLVSESFTRSMCHMAQRWSSTFVFILDQYLAPWHVIDVIHVNSCYSSHCPRVSLDFHGNSEKSRGLGGGSLICLPRPSLPGRRQIETQRKVKKRLALVVTNLEEAGYVEARSKLEACSSRYHFQTSESISVVGGDFSWLNFLSGANWHWLHWQFVRSFL
jgi:hypothetical protein